MEIIGLILSIIYFIWLGRLIAFGIRTAVQINANTAATAASLALLVEAMTPEAKQRILDATEKRAKEEKAKYQQMALPPSRFATYRNGKTTAWGYALIAIVIIGGFLFAFVHSSRAESTVQRDAPTTRFYDSRGKSTGSASQYGDQIKLYDDKGKLVGTISSSKDCGGCRK